MKNKLFITSIIIAVVSLGISVATAYFMFNNDLPRVVGFDNIPALDMIVATTTSDAVEWKTYENIEYGYSVNYPANKAHPVIDSDGSATDMHIDDVNISVLVLEKKESLDSFSNLIYQLNTPNIKERSFKQVSFLESKAYSFISFNSFNLPFGSYILPDPNKYIITENNNGDKIIIHYPVDNSLSEEIIKTFKFSK